MFRHGFLRKVPFFLLFIFFLSACGGAGVKVISAEYVDSINVGGVFYNYEGQKIVELHLDFNFDASVTEDLDPQSDDFRDELFGILHEGAHFYNGDEEVESTYGYWPDEAGVDFAKDMTLFYVVPESSPDEDLRFVFDGDILGDEDAGLDTTLNFN